MDSIIAELQERVAELRRGPTGRSVSIAITHLETSILWLLKAQRDGEV